MPRSDLTVPRSSGGRKQHDQSTTWCPVSSLELLCKWGEGGRARHLSHQSQRLLNSPPPRPLLIRGGSEFLLSTHTHTRTSFEGNGGLLLRVRKEPNRFSVGASCSVYLAGCARISDRLVGIDRLYSSLRSLVFFLPSSPNTLEV